METSTFQAIQEERSVVFLKVIKNALEGMLCILIVIFIVLTKQQFTIGVVFGVIGLFFFIKSYVYQKFFDIPKQIKILQKEISEEETALIKYQADYDQFFSPNGEPITDRDHILGWECLVDILEVNTLEEAIRELPREISRTKRSIIKKQELISQLQNIGEKTFWTYIKSKI